MTPAERRANGFSLLELVVSSAAGLLVVAMVVSVLGTHRTVAAGERAALELEDGLRRTLATLAREIRAGGFDPLDAGSFDGRADGIARAGAARLHLRGDVEGEPDGEVAPGSTEEIRIYRSDASGAVLLGAGGRADPLTGPGQVEPGGLLFRYFDGCGTEIVPGGGELDAAARARIARVDVALSLTERGRSAAARISAALRNRPPPHGCAP